MLKQIYCNMRCSTLVMSLENGICFLVCVPLHNAAPQHWSILEYLTSVPLTTFTDMRTQTCRLIPVDADAKSSDADAKMSASAHLWPTPCTQTVVIKSFLLASKQWLVLRCLLAKRDTQRSALSHNGGHYEYLHIFKDLSRLFIFIQPMWAPGQ